MKEPSAARRGSAEMAFGGMAGHWHTPKKTDTLDGKTATMRGSTSQMLSMFKTNQGLGF
jgi:hypothetical protein